MLPKINRLKKKKDFERVFKEGKGFKEDFIFLKLRPNNLKVSRFSFVVSQKVSKKATLRNKIKRRLKAGVQARLAQIKKGWDGILIANPGIDRKDPQEIRQTIGKLFHEANLFKDD